MNYYLLPSRPNESQPLSSYAKEQEIFRAKAHALKKRRQLRRFALLKLWLRDPRRASQRVFNRLHQGTDHTDVLHPRRAFDT